MAGNLVAQAVSAATASAPAPGGSAAGAAADAVSAASVLPSAGPRSGFGLALDRLEYGIMVPLLYVALAFLLVALSARLVRILRAPGPPYQLAIYPAPRLPLLAALRDAFGMPQVLRRAPLFWVFLMMYHVGVLALLLGHLDLFPAIRIMPAGSRHMLGAGLVGVMVTLPTFYFLGRRFMGENRKISTPGDYFLLLLLLFLFLFGDLMSWGNSWTASGFVMTKSDFSRYFGILANLSFADPRTVLHGAHYHFIVIHVFLAELFFFVLPFTKVMHAFLALPVEALRRQVWKRS
jgi:nitrate reductase gamma subunit